ncbi:MAG TPA: hypothetical protein VHO46_15085 [Bacteroidales bacterium]|nr:hypothetical protein [Bacteroidales bacterium]
MYKKILDSSNKFLFVLFGNRTIALVFQPGLDHSERHSGNLLRNIFILLK